MESDDLLLTRWTRQRDPAAFATLAERHAGLVYGTCRRITGDHHAAEDLAQDVLLELAQKAQQIRRSTAGFLHAAARARSLNHLRDAGIRQRHEAAAGREAPTVAAEATGWHDLEPLLDAALAELPEDERTALTLHFLEGRSQVETAELLGTTQATVSRRLARGLETLRNRLASAGLVLTLAGLSDLCAAHAAESAPPVVLTAVPKITLAAAGSVAASAATGTSWLLAGGILVAALATGWFLLPRTRTLAAPPTQESTHIVHQAAVTPQTTAPTVIATPTTTTPRPPAMTKPEPVAAASTVKPGPFTLTGNGQNRDSVALALVAAGQAYGKTFDYTEATCRLGNAFAPGIDRPEDCTSHMQVEGRLLDRNLSGAAAALGLHADRVSFPDRVGSADDEAVRLRHRQTVAAEVVRLQAAGRLVLISGGWEMQSPHGFRHWAYAGILTQADPAAGLLLGAHPQGGQDNPLRFICQTGYEAAGTGLYAWSVAPATAAQPDYRATLRLAIDRIRGQGLFVDDGRDVFGLAAMDWWIALMRRDAGFCAPCWGRRQAGKIPWDAYENALRMRQGAQAAVGFLRACGSRLTATARPHLDSAATCYDRIAVLLAFAVAKSEPGSYPTFLGDLAAQQRHADEVLLPVRQALEEAAGHLEKALAETPPLADLGGGKAEEVGNAAAGGTPPRVPVVRLRWTDGTFDEMHAIATVAAAAGLDYDLPTLMAASGLAFRIQMCSYEAWCPSGFSGLYGFHSSSALSRHIPSLVRLTADDGAALSARIVQSLDAGVPVAAKGDWWWGVILAHRADGGKDEWRLATYDGPRTATSMPSLAWVAMPPAGGYRSAMARAVLLQALELAAAPRQPGPREGSWYVSGNAAWSAWIEILRRDDAAFQPIIADHRGDGGLATCYRRNLTLLAKARSAAADWCQATTALAPAPAAGHLRQAATAYRATSDILLSSPDRLPRKNAWPAIQRAEEANVIERAAAQETAAITALQATIDAWP